MSTESPNAIERDRDRLLLECRRLTLEALDYRSALTSGQLIAELERRGFKVSAVKDYGDLPPIVIAGRLTEAPEGEHRENQTHDVWQPDHLIRRGGHVARSHCDAGHELEGDNLGIRLRSGARYCRTCSREAGRAAARRVAQ